MTTDAAPRARAKRAPSLSALRDQVGALNPAHLRCLPLLRPLEPLFPGRGLPRGTLVETTGAGATLLALSLAAGPSRTGSWVAALGFPHLGWEAAAEVGLVLERVVAVPDLQCQGPTVVAALLDSFDVVLCGPEVRPTASQSRRLRARARERAAVLVAVGGPGATADPGARRARVHGWEGADARFEVSTTRWEGLGRGWGHLTGRRLSVVAEGRGAMNRSCGHEIHFERGTPTAHRALGFVDRVGAARVDAGGTAEPLGDVPLEWTG